MCFDFEKRKKIYSPRCCFSFAAGFRAPFYSAALHFGATQKYSYQQSIGGAVFLAYICARETFLLKPIMIEMITTDIFCFFLYQHKE